MKRHHMPTYFEQLGSRIAEMPAMVRPPAALPFRGRDLFRAGPNEADAISEFPTPRALDDPPAVPATPSVITQPANEHHAAAPLPVALTTPRTPLPTKRGEELMPAIPIRPMTPSQAGVASSASTRSVEMSRQPLQAVGTGPTRDSPRAALSTIAPPRNVKVSSTRTAQALPEHARLLLPPGDPRGERPAPSEERPRRFPASPRERTTAPRSLHIGKVEVVVTAEPAGPAREAAIRPAQNVLPAAPATVAAPVPLSRGFVSGLGLRQG